MKQKFSEMYETLQSGNIADFRQWLKTLTKSKLLQFACYCAHYGLLDVFEIEKHYNS